MLGSARVMKSMLRRPFVVLAPATKNAFPVHVRYHPARLSLDQSLIVQQVEITRHVAGVDRQSGRQLADTVGRLRVANMSQQTAGLLAAQLPAAHERLGFRSVGVSGEANEQPGRVETPKRISR